MFQALFWAFSHAAFENQGKVPIYKLKFSSTYYYKPIFNLKLAENYMKEIQFTKTSSKNLFVQCIFSLIS